MRRTNKCGSVRNDEILKLTLGIWCKSLIQHSLPLARHTNFIDFICPNNQPEKDKESRNEIKLSTNCIVLHWPAYTDCRARRGRL